MNGNYKCLMLIAIMVSMTASLGNTAEMDYSLNEFVDLLSNIPLQSSQEDSSTSALVDFSGCDDLISAQTSAAFNNTLNKFKTTRNLVHALVKTWSESKVNQQTTIKIEISSDGTLIYFDEGLWFVFDDNEKIFAIKHWDDYSLNATASYKKIFADIHGVSPSEEHSFHFAGDCQGNLTR